LEAQQETSQKIYHEFKLHVKSLYIAFGLTTFFYLYWRNDHVYSIYFALSVFFYI